MWKKACSGGSVDKALKGRDEGVGVYILIVDHEPLEAVVEVEVNWSSLASWFGLGAGPPGSGEGPPSPGSGALGRSWAETGRLDQLTC